MCGRSFSFVGMRLRATFRALRRESIPFACSPSKATVYRFPCFGSRNVLPPPKLDFLFFAFCPPKANACGFPSFVWEFSLFTLSPPKAKMHGLSGLSFLEVGSSSFFGGFAFCHLKRLQLDFLRFEPPESEDVCFCTLKANTFRFRFLNF